MDATDLLRDDISRGRSVVIVGTGVTMSATNGDPASSWPGLLRSGIEFTLARTGDQGWSGAISSLLDEAITTEDLLVVASEISSRLGSEKSADFADWLQRTVGSLHIHKRAALEAIGRLSIPILTTNYDDLIEQVNGLEHVDWTQGPLFQQVVAGTYSAVGHIHGHWSNPRGIVLTAESYSMMLGDSSAETVRRALATVNNVVYVGFGSGLNDPTFGSLRAWMRDWLPEQALQHYRLCTTGEASKLSIEHADDPITVVPYGPTHDHLAPFLLTLAPSVDAVGIEASSSLEVLRQDVRENSILSQQIPSRGQATVDELLIPPPVLPVPQEAYAHAVRNDPDNKPLRCNLDDECVMPDPLLLVGDDYDGLTSALKWLAYRYVETSSPVEPVVFLDFAKVQSGVGGLERAIRAELPSVGIHVDLDSPLPPISIALDNMTAAPPGRLARAVSEIRSLPVRRVWYGCKTPMLTHVQERLESSYGHVRVRYLGRMNRQDVHALADLVDPARKEEIVDRAAQLVREHQLPRTPFTFSLIISALLHGDALLNASSQTTLLNAYVSVLMGWGRPDDNSRLGFDSEDRARLIGALAKLFVEHRSGSLDQGTVVDFLGSYLERYGIAENAVDVLKDLDVRQILALRGKQVSFRQSSYLHLFAAKHAERDRAFLETLLEKALLFTPIIGHYAALNREDEGVLRHCMSLLEGFPEFAPNSMGLFAHGADPEHVGENSADHLPQQIAREMRATPTPDDDSVDDLDDVEEQGLEDAEKSSFPFEDIDQAPLSIQMAITLTLASNVLRDSEYLEDQTYRRNALKQLLLRWGHFVLVLTDDEGYQSMIEEAAEEIGLDLKLDERARKRFKTDFVQFAPAAFALGGVSSSLSSKKLSIALDAILGDPEFFVVGDATLPAVFLSFDIRARGWARQLPHIQKEHASSQSISSVMRKLVMFAYMQDKDLADDQSHLEEFLAGQIAYERGEVGLAFERSKGAIIQQLKSQKRHHQQLSQMSGATDELAR